MKKFWEIPKIPPLGFNKIIQSTASPNIHAIPLYVEVFPLIQTNSWANPYSQNSQKN